VAIDAPLGQVVSYYKLGDLIDCCRVKHGYVNETWRIRTTTGLYMLKRRHPDLANEGLVRAQHSLIRHLTQSGFPAPNLVGTQYGTTFVQHDDRLYEIQGHIPGELCDRDDPLHVRSAARTLGWYHQLVRGYDDDVLEREQLRYGPRRLRHIFEHLTAKWYRHMRPGLRPLIDALQAHVADLERELASIACLPSLIVHGDYYAENLIMSEGNVVGVVDYDQAHRSARATELAEALIYFARERGQRFHHIVYSNVLNLSTMETFLKAYGAYVHLTQEEANALPHLIRTVWLCASLAPPLGPELDAQRALQALPEALTLANWAKQNASNVALLASSTETRDTVSSSTPETIAHKARA
jgi:Ser/Thr protein kinase RdoA (MazF antagonist)